MNKIKLLLTTIENVYKQKSRTDKISISVGDLVDMRSHILNIEKDLEVLRQQLKYSETRRQDTVSLYESLRVTDNFDNYKLDTQA